MDWENEIEHIIEMFNSDIQDILKEKEDDLSLYRQGKSVGISQVITRLQIALDESRKSKFTD